MKNLAIWAALLGAGVAFGQNTPQNPQPQNAPAQNPPAQQPTLEQPKMEEPPEEKAPEKAPDKTPPDTKKPAAAAAKPADKPAGEAKVVEEIIARVNNDIITRSELDKAKSQAAEDAQQDCGGRCTQEQLQVAVEDRQKYALRDLIDQSLLAQRGKDMGVNVEPEVVKQLDEIRKKNNLKDLDE